MKILIVGDWRYDIYEKALANAFFKKRNIIAKFAINDYLKKRSFFIKLQNKFLLGPIFRKINKDLIKRVEIEKPELVFIYRGNAIFAKTIKEIKKSKALVFGYNNDDPFSAKHPFYMWRHFLKAAPHYDHIFVYRQKNLDDYKKIGYRNTSLLRSYYLAEKNFPIKKLLSEKYKCDVIFVGHWENDGRDEYIKAIIDRGINFKLFGSEWQRSKYYNFFKNKLGEIYSLDQDYNLAINSAKIVLCFLSKLNNDTYTRRNFEIPAAKTFMLSEYSNDLNELFAAGQQADYFRTKEEMIEKIKFYLQNSKEREKIALAGYQKLLTGGHEVLDRAKEVLAVFNKYKKLQ